MSRYIDADEAEKLLRAGCAYAIWELPSIDIVRCKECKWYKQSEAFCENGNGLWQAGDECFCSYGEREDE